MSKRKTISDDYRKVQERISRVPNCEHKILIFCDTLSVESVLRFLARKAQRDRDRMRTG